MTAAAAPRYAKYGSAALAILFVGRAWILCAAPAGMSGDAFGYVATAGYIAEFGRLPPLYLQSAGFPLLLAPLTAIAGDDLPRAVLRIHCLMDLLVVFTMVGLVWRSFAARSQAWPRIALCALIVVQPFTATMIDGMYPDHSCGFFLFFGVYFLHRAAVHPNHAVLAASLAGVLLGVAGIEKVDLLPVGAGLVAFFAFHMLTRRNAPRSSRAAIFGLACALAAPPAALIALQFRSTGEIGLIRVADRYENPGYFSWLRTSFLFESEHNRLAFGRGSEGWEGFEIAQYPSRVFGSAEEKAEVGELLDAWKAGGMTPQIDARFSSLARRKVDANPAWSYVALPGLRMLNHWINVDGAQTLLRTLEMRRPWSTAIVVLVFCLRLALLALCLAGFAALVKHGNSLPDPGRLSVLASFAAVAVLLRTIELGALGIFFEAGLMEYRYAGIVFSSAMLVSIYGAFYLVNRSAREDVSARHRVRSNSASN